MTHSAVGIFAGATKRYPSCIGLIRPTKPKALLLNPGRCFILETNNLSKLLRQKQEDLWSVLVACSLRRIRQTSAAERNISPTAGLLDDNGFFAVYQSLQFSSIFATFLYFPARKKTILKQFLPCDALRCTVFVIVILSVRLSVCLSVRLSHSWTVSTWFDLRS